MMSCRCSAEVRRDLLTWGGGGCIATHERCNAERSTISVEPGTQNFSSR